jgi:N-carbamoyl-L-amino-acid hydrolase
MDNLVEEGNTRAMTETLHINCDRLIGRLNELAKIGATPAGGVHRLAYTDEDKAGRDLFVRWCEDAGLAVRVDEMGNIFARHGAADSPPVFAGSHLDSQPKGGRYDGAYGVLGALEAVQSIKEAGHALSHPVEVVAWSNEEGSRFPPSMIGSGVFAGNFTLDYAYGCTSRDGKTQGEELERIGYKGDVPCKAGPLHRYFELHIEQGPILDAEKLQIGVVEGVYGLYWLELRLKGQANHAGSTPMDIRRDALMSAAEIFLAAEKLPGELGEGNRLTVGYIEAIPNSVNVIPGDVIATFDLRSQDPATLDRMRERLSALIEEVATRRGIEHEIVELSANPMVTFAPACRDVVEQAALDLGLSHRRLYSGPGHDAVWVSTVCDTGMIFVPSIGGISHAEIEDTNDDDLAAGATVLASAMWKSAAA